MKVIEIIQSSLFHEENWKGGHNPSNISMIDEGLTILLFFFHNIDVTSFAFI